VFEDNIDIYFPSPFFITYTLHIIQFLYFYPRSDYFVTITWLRCIIKYQNGRLKNANWNFRCSFYNSSKLLDPYSCDSRWLSFKSNSNIFPQQPFLSFSFLKLSLSSFKWTYSVFMECIIYLMLSALHYSFRVCIDDQIRASSFDKFT
jgi:hypothetical protein